MEHSRGTAFAAVTAIALVIVGCILVALGYSVGQLWAHNTHRNEQISERYASRTRERIVTECSDKEGIILLGCVQEIVEASRGAQLEEKDLTAQESMAKIALWTFLVSSVGLLLSAAGLVALYVSLKQTRVVIRDNREIGEAQVRAYIGSPEVRARLETVADVTWFRIEAFLSNSGNSPALLPSVACFIKKGNQVLNTKIAPLERDIAGGEKDYCFLKQGHPVDSKMRDFYYRGGHLIFEGLIRYSTVFGGPQKTTSFRLRLTRTAEGDGPFHVALDGHTDDGDAFSHYRD